MLPVVPPPLSEGLVEFGGPHGFGKGSRFSVRDGWAPDSEVPPRAENGLLPNYRERDPFKKRTGKHLKWHWQNKTMTTVKECVLTWINRGQ